NWWCNHTTQILPERSRSQGCQSIQANGIARSQILFQSRHFDSVVKLSRHLPGRVWSSGPMSEAYDISVVISTYNRSDLLDEAIKAVLCQNKNGETVNYQVIVVDNNSTDDTRKDIES